jgi:hypothetical protein
VGSYPIGLGTRGDEKVYLVILSSLGGVDELYSIARESRNMIRDLVEAMIREVKSRALSISGHCAAVSLTFSGPYFPMLSL